MTSRALSPLAAHLAEMLEAEHGTPGAAPAREAPKAKDTWAPDYNPALDAVAVVVFGATFVRPGRYISPDGMPMDHNGALLDPEECPECGTIPGGVDFRFMVRVTRPEHRFAKRPVYEWTHCSRCITPEELERVRSGAAAAPPPAPRKQKQPARAGRQMFD